VNEGGVLGMRASQARFASIVALLTIVATALFAVVAATAPAGNRDVDVTFDDFPGPDEVTFGKNVAYTASLTSTPGTGTFTNVKYSMTRPSTVVNGGPPKTASGLPLVPLDTVAFQGFAGVTTIATVPEVLPRLGRWVDDRVTVALGRNCDTHPDPSAWSGSISGLRQLLRRLCGT
jgi:hypothetical protein